MKRFMLQPLMYALLLVLLIDDVGGLGQGDSGWTNDTEGVGNVESDLPSTGYLPDWVAAEEAYPCGGLPYCPHGTTCLRPYFLTGPKICVHDDINMEKDLLRSPRKCPKVNCPKAENCDSTLVMVLSIIASVFLLIFIIAVIFFIIVLGSILVMLRRIGHTFSNVSFVRRRFV